MKVLLVQPRYTYAKGIPLVVEMPLGLCYIAAVLRQRGHDVRILDCLAEGYRIKEKTGDKITYGLPDRRIIQKIREFKPQVVGCSALFSIQYDNARKLCELIKKIDPGIITVMGGMHPTVRPREVLAENAVDFIFQGESDCTLSEFIDAPANGSNYSEIDGIGYKDASGLHIKPKGRFIENLDELPFLARDLLDVNSYFQAGLAHGFVLKDKRNVNLLTSRGCPGRCIFCTIHLMWGRRFRARSPENVMVELEHLKDIYGARHVQFEDDNLTHDIVRAKKIFRGMIDGNLNVKWTTPNGVALWCMDREALDLMKSSGCYYVKFAVESGSQKVLTDIIQKPQDLEKVIPLIVYARSIGLKVGSFFVVGLPGETKEQIRESFDFPYKVKLDWVEYSIATPHYGTELRNICQKGGYLKTHSCGELFARKGLIDTPEFSAERLEQKIIEENKKYIKYLMFHQPATILSQGWEAFRRNPSFVIEYVFKNFGFKNTDNN